MSSPYIMRAPERYTFTGQKTVLLLFSNLACINYHFFLYRSKLTMRVGKQLTETDNLCTVRSCVFNHDHLLFFPYNTK